MRADICDPHDEIAVARFRHALDRLGAQRTARHEALGVDMYKLRIGSDEITVFSDQWSIDIDGAPEVIGLVLDEFRRETDA